MASDITIGVNPNSISSSDANIAFQLLELIQGARRTKNKEKECEYRQAYNSLVSRLGFSDTISFEVALAAHRAMKR